MAGISAAASGKSAGWVERLLRSAALSSSRMNVGRRSSPNSRRPAERNTAGTTSPSSDTPAMDGVEFAYGLDLSRCVGCRRCVYACVHENNQSRDPQIHWIRVLEMGRTTASISPSPTSTTTPRRSPNPRASISRWPASSAANRPAPRSVRSRRPGRRRTASSSSTPTGASAAAAACRPAPTAPATSTGPSRPSRTDEINPDIHVFGNRPRPKGVVEKCTFCIQTNPQGALPRVRRDLPGRGAQVRQSPR